MDKMVDHLFVFEGNAEIKDLTGNYTAYRQQMLKTKKNNISDAKEKIKVSTLSTVTVVKEPEKKVKLSYKEKAEFDSLEKDMETLEIEKDKLSVILSNPSSDNDALMIAGKRLSVVVKEIEEKTDRWLELSEYV